MNTSQPSLFKSSQYSARSPQTQRNGLPPKTPKPQSSSPPSSVSSNITNRNRQNEVLQDNVRMSSSFSSGSSSSSTNLSGSTSNGQNSARQLPEETHSHNKGSKWMKEKSAVSPVKSCPLSTHQSLLESSTRPSLSSVSAVQASLPALEARHVKSQEVAKPVLQHAMAPRKLTGTPSQISDTFQRYNVNPSGPTSVGPLASGRCEALTLVGAVPPPPPAYDQLQYLNESMSSQNGLYGVNGSFSDESPQAPPQNSGYNKHAMVLMSPMERTETDKSSQPSQPEEDSQPELYVSNRPRWSAKAYQLYMTLRLENILKYCEERRHRRLLLEQELDKSDFDDERRQLFRQALNHHESKHLRWKRSRKMGTKDFDKVRTVGVGAFGEVVLARKKDSGDYFAIKILNKVDIKRRNQDAHVTAERDILSEASNEWVVKLFYSFQDEVNLYFVMEYVAGGDLMRVLEELQQFDEELARFYTSELVLAIGSVHEMGFVHRDIKPDNILIDRHGHIKLTDFGLCTGHRWTHRSQNYHAGETGQQAIHIRTDSLAFPNRQHQIQAANQHKRGSGRRLGGPMLHRSKKVHQRQLAHSQVGTPNYMAPEVITSNSQSGYTQVCDWWSTGVILYEMLYGRPPFHAESAEDIQYNIIHHEETLRLKMGYNLSPAAVDLVRCLICSPEDRLGSRGTDEIKKHPFFHEVDWSSDLRQRQAPYVPLIRSQEDTSNFDIFPEYSSAFPSESTSSSQSSPQRTPSANPSPAMDDKSHHFFEFTFRRFFDTQTFDNVAVLRTPICENDEPTSATLDPPISYASQCDLYQQPDWRSSSQSQDSWNVTAPPPILAHSYSPESSMAYQHIREPPPYSAAVNFDGAPSSIVRGVPGTGQMQLSPTNGSSVQPRSAQRDDNAAVYV